ncbi:hypothetical protein VTO42DRAFT_4517 [Malbranchea cinnamomea]
MSGTLPASSRGSGGVLTIPIQYGRGGAPLLSQRFPSLPFPSLPQSSEQVVVPELASWSSVCTAWSLFLYLSCSHVVVVRGRSEVVRTATLVFSVYPSQNPERERASRIESNFPFWPNNGGLARHQGRRRHAKLNTEVLRTTHRRDSSPPSLRMHVLQRTDTVARTTWMRAMEWVKRSCVGQRRNSWQLVQSSERGAARARSRETTN